MATKKKNTASKLSVAKRAANFVEGTYKREIHKTAKMYDNKIPRSERFDRIESGNQVPGNRSATVKSKRKK